MKVIAHRGNINGPSELENHPLHIRDVLKLGFDCEVDVWYKDGEYWLGHDEPTYDISRGFLQNDKLWCHAKNLEALEMMLECDIHCFWHEEDDFTLTSKRHIWTYPNKRLTENSICVLPELGYNGELKDCLGICSDFIEKYK